jgi:uncharacterized protein
MMRVEVVRAWPRRHEAVAVEIPPGATVVEAVAASGLETPEVSGYAIFGERAEAATPLRDGDRVELLRPLEVDPKQARRLRAAARGRS